LSCKITHNAQSQGKRTWQSYISRREKQHGSWGRSTGVRGQSPRRCGDYTAFFPKTHIFRHILV